MRSLRTTGPLFRALLAVVFGFMSLAHVPIMSFANASTMPRHHVSSIAAPAHSHHQHQQHLALPGSAALPDGTGICTGLGCFQAVSPASVCAPVAYFSPAGKLVPASAVTMSPAMPDPAVPPPRLQA